MPSCFGARAGNPGLAELKPVYAAPMSRDGSHRKEATPLRPWLFGVFAMLLSLGAALAIDASFFSHAMSVAWHATDAQGQRFEMTRTVEHRLTFPNQHRALARYIEHWNFDRMPPPMTPPIDAVVLAHLDVPAGSNIFIGSTGSGVREVRVDGHAIGDEGIAPGAHWLEVSWRDTHPNVSTSFAITQGYDRAATDPLPRAWVTSAGGAWTTSRRVFWGLASLFMLAATLLATRIAMLEGLSRRRLVEKVATAVILLLALSFRLFDSDVMPQYLENGDELFALWNGWSILHEGVPRGWTLWPDSYGGQPITMTLLSMHGVEWHVIEPYFEHPPLLHVLVGGAATIGGATHWSHARLADGRIVPILLSTLTAWLVMLIARRTDRSVLRPSPAPWLAGLVYAVLPTIAIQGRVIKEEAILTPLIAGCVLAFLRWRDDGHRTRDAVLAASLAGVCMLAKVTGFAVVAALVGLFIYERQIREGVRAGFIGIGFASLFPIFGALINWPVFLETQRLQGGRPTHFNLFLRFFDDGMINMTLIGRGWLLFLWLATLSTAFVRPRRDTLALYLIPLFYMAAIGLGSGNWTYGWYIAPILPYLAIGAGRFLADLWREGDFVRGTVFSLTGLMYGFNFLLDPNHAKQATAWPEIRLHVTLLLAAMLTPYALSSIFRAPRIGRAALALSLVVFTGLSGYFVTHYDVIYQRYHDFDRDAYFDR